MSETYNSINLIVPKSEHTSASILWQPPLGILSLATYIKRHNPQVETKVFNEEISPLPPDVFDTDIMAINTQISNYKRCLELAKKAKENNCLVVFGGAFATCMPTKILKNRDFVDAIVIGDGELALNEIIKKRALREINNLAYRKGNAILLNKQIHIDLNSIPFPDRSFINLDIYFRNFRKFFPNSAFKRPTTFYSQKGCLWHEKTGGCIFCGRIGKYRVVRPRKFWQEIEYLERAYKIDYAFDQADCFCQSRTWLKDLIRSKPSKINLKFRVWVRSDNIDNETAKILSGLGVHDAFIGVESGDPKSLSAFQKGTTPQQNIRATEILNKFRIKVYAQFVLGAPGETKESLRNSIKHAQELIQIGNVETLACTIMLPLPGSKSWAMMKQKTNILESDIFDYKKLQKIWIKEFTNVKIEAIEETIKEIERLPSPMHYVRKEL